MTQTTQRPQESTHDPHTASRRKVIAGTTTVLVPTGLSTTVLGQEGQPSEVTINATVPSGTEALLHVFDADGDSETINIEDGQTTHELGTLAGDGEYYIEVELHTDDEQASPEIDSVELRLGDPLSPPDDDLGIWRLWDNFMVWIVAAVGSAFAIGLASKSMAVASMGAYLVFAYIAVQTGVPLLTNILYITLVLIFVGFGFKIWRLEGAGNV